MDDIPTHEEIEEALLKESIGEEEQANQLDNGFMLWLQNKRLGLGLSFDVWRIFSAAEIRDLEDMLNFASLGAEAILSILSIQQVIE